MKFESSVVAIALASLATPSMAFQPSGTSIRALHGQQQTITRVTAPGVEEETKTSGSSSTESSELKALTLDIVSKLRFREVQKELELRELDTSGTFTDMKFRLKQLVTDEDSNKSNDSSEDVRVIGEDELNKVSYIIRSSMA